MSENATFISRGASQSSRRQNDVEPAQFVCAQFAKSLRDFDESFALRTRDHIFRERLEFSDVICATKWFCAQRVRVSDGDFIHEFAAIVEQDFHAAAEGLL